ncbi:hypothetical protein [Microbacterium sp. C7(2022)]|uniref:hypothetical protein n=1 Tax=Microbacterium sp. C7(2022) TaxID=2992759 RepID=UPI00237BDF86|nr:hypothetical protein [Microbacterium sp. C7(2022)]MDE0547452.1 hypothetical protein [Microbacterium sp. C7(2022)]
MLSGYLSQGARRSGQGVWFVDDDSALLIRDPAAEPIVTWSGHWRRCGPDGSLIASA